MDSPTLANLSGQSCTRVTLVTKGLYVGGLGVFGLLSIFGLVIHISQRVAITRYQDKQLGLHAVCGQRCRQDEALDDFARDDDLSKDIERGGFRALQGKSCLPRACTTR